MNPVIEKLHQNLGLIPQNLPDFKVGDTVKVYVRISEGDNKRIQLFAGTVISRTGSGVAGAFTVRRVAYGQGMERVFPLNCRNIEKIEIDVRGDIKRAKLFYLRERTGKSARIKTKGREKIAKEVKAAKEA